MILFLLHQPSLLFLNPNARCISLQIRNCKNLRELTTCAGHDCCTSPRRCSLPPRTRRLLPAKKKTAPSVLLCSFGLREIWGRKLFSVSSSLGGRCARVARAGGGSLVPTGQRLLLLLLPGAPAVAASAAASLCSALS